ncbi:MAG TPA: DUF5615 family PIN-like protein [Candidatus Xenobia bacterium]
MKLAADENFNNDILRGLMRRLPALDVVRIQDTEIAGAEDPDVLAWTAREERVLLTHDVRTMRKYAAQRVSAGEPMPGVLVVNGKVPLGAVIEDLVLFCHCSKEGEWEGQIQYVPIV